MVINDSFAKSVIDGVLGLEKRGGSARVASLRHNSRVNTVDVRNASPHHVLVQILPQGWFEHRQVVQHVHSTNGCDCC